ncbi:microtubule-associated proteins 1A/1B light chain 3C isoform X3 [Amphiprion ocellaris]|uniref:microtubule-associated proteins 1A/1B light chain 3C isoform X3 n=1 Tax=Amphiprion ocellaris TaxID=80972 RepID=UPI001649A704|nr:microtubule-associated proteins 1A/1B light chain 3C isoform X3 [Amphiprion ocellaris]
MDPETVTRRSCGAERCIVGRCYDEDNSLATSMKETHGAAAQSGLLPAHQQQRAAQHVAHHGSGVQGPPGRGRLPLHDLRLAGDVRTASSSCSTFGHRLLERLNAVWKDSRLCCSCCCGRMDFND